MTVPEAVFTHLKNNSSRKLCDDCIAKSLSLAKRQQVQQVTSTLALTREFFRGIDLCDGCGAASKSVTVAL